jgi:hypothetical protein
MYSSPPAPFVAAIRARQRLEIVQVAISFSNFDLHKILAKFHAVRSNFVKVFVLECQLA